MEFRAFRAKTTSFEDEQPFCQSEGQSSIARDFSRAADFLGNAQALLRVYGRVNYTFDCKFYRNNFLIDGFFVFLKVFVKVLKNVHSSHQ